MFLTHHLPRNNQHKSQILGLLFIAVGWFLDFAERGKIRVRTLLRVTVILKDSRTIALGREFFHHGIQIFIYVFAFVLRHY